MKTGFEVILLVILLLILAVAVWNAFSLRFIRKHLKDFENLSKEYIDIRYKLQLITTIGSIVIAIIAFYGYNSEERINKLMDSTINNKILEKEGEISLRFNDTLNLYLKRISLTERAIQKIENKEIINAEIYIVADQKISSSDFKVKSKRIYYNSLRTITGKVLPKFTLPPVINILPTNGMEYIITNKTKDFFELKIIASADEISTFDIWFAK